MKEFEKIKSEIWFSENAYTVEGEKIKSLYEIDNEKEVIDFIKKHFVWLCRHSNFIDVIDNNNTIMSRWEFYHNKPTSEGYCVINDNKLVDVYGGIIYAARNAHIIVHMKTVVEAGDYAMVTTVNDDDRSPNSSIITLIDYASGNIHGACHVMAFDNAKITLFDKSDIVAFGAAVVSAHDYSKVRGYKYTTISAHYKSSVKAYDNCVVNRQCKFAHVELNDSAICIFENDITRGD